MRRALVVAAVFAVLLLFGATPVGAFPLNGCTMSLQSTGADGTAVHAAEGGSPDATETDPFIVDWDGSVAWSGTTGSQVIKNNAWHIEVFGLPTPLRGGSANGDGNQTGHGTVGVKENAPFRFTGLYFVSGGISGQGGSCEGSGWLRLAGDPVGTIPFFVGLIVLVLGLLLLVSGVNGHAVSGILGGLLMGLGLAVLLVIYSTMPAGAATPAATLALGLTMGAIVALIGRMRARRASA
jgi:hypothetical protein